MNGFLQFIVLTIQIIKTIALTNCFNNQLVRIIVLTIQSVKTVVLIIVSVKNSSHHY